MSGVFEIVNGTIIGSGDSYCYEFWQTASHPACQYPLYLKPSRFAKGHFANDEEAESWLKAHYPSEYSYGVEMRCFDR